MASPSGAETLFKLESPHKKVSQVTAPSGGYVEGQIVKIEDTIGIIPETVLINVTVAFVYQANKYRIAKATGSGTAIAVGDKVWVNLTNQNVVNTSVTGNYPIGTALEAAADGATEVLIEFDGSFHTAAIVA